MLVSSYGTLSDPRLLARRSAGPFTIDDANRKELIELILKDLSILAKVAGASGKTRLTSKGRVPFSIICRAHLMLIYASRVDAAQAFLAIKCMGKNPAGSEVLATPTNLSTLLALSAAFKEDVEASNEALRCIANALLLVQDARLTFVQKNVGGREASIDLLEVSGGDSGSAFSFGLLFRGVTLMAAS